MRVDGSVVGDVPRFSGGGLSEDGTNRWPSELMRRGLQGIHARRSGEAAL